MSTIISIEQEKLKFHKSLKIVLFPTESQKELLNKTFGCCRQIYNNRLSEKQDFYIDNILTIPKEERKSKSKDIWKQFKPTTEKEMTLKFPYMKEVSSSALQQARMNCEQAFSNFYKSLSGKRKGQKVGYPKFKSKKDSRQSYREPQPKLEHFDYTHRTLKIPKVGKVYFKSHNLPKWFSLVSDICSLTIEKSSANRYYASILFELKNDYRVEIENRKDAIGLDFDCDDCYIDSEGKSALKDYGFVKQKQENHKRLKKLSKRFNRKLKIQDTDSPRKIDSKNRAKAKIKLARFEEKIANKRKDWIEKESLRLVKNYDKIVIENLNLKGMIQGSKNAKNYVDISWSTFVSKLQDKGKTFGCEIVKADRFFASSQTCSNCGFKYPEVQKKHLQNWICPNCGTSHQRDVNAAINLKNYIPIEHRKFTTMDFVEGLVSQALAVSGAEDEVVTWKAITKKNPIGL